jgi:hypothetical protein
MAKVKNTSPVPKAPSRAKKAPAALTRSSARLALDRATKTIRGLQKDVARNAWRIGRSLALVAELGLHRARGFASLEEYAAKSLDLTAGTAFLYMRVAQAFSETAVATYGAERLDRGLRYIAATPEDEAPKELPTLKVRVRDDAGAVREKDFSEVTLVELRAATKAEREAARPRTKRAAEDTASLLERVNAALDAAVGPSVARAAEVRLRESGGKAVMDVRGVPRARATAAFRAIATALRDAR